MVSYHHAERFVFTWYEEFLTWKKYLVLTKHLEMPFGFGVISSNLLNLTNLMNLHKYIYLCTVRH